MLWSLVPVGLSSPAFATSGPTLTGSNSLSGIYGSTIDITNLQISDTGNPTEQVRLVVSNGSLSMTTTTGLTFTGGSTGAQLKFSGTLTNVNAALATLHYTRTSGIGADTLEVTLVGANQVYNPTNGHLYEYVTSDGSQTWTNAKTLADARTAAGATGYLATMTSDAENTFISDRLTGAGWMGASDSAIEGDWKWVEGPETGTSFWSGLAANNGTPGSPVGGQYNKWNTGEPNNAGNEDCGQFLSGTGGQWNDLPCTVTTLAGYVVEYGAPGNLPQVASKNITLTITNSIRNVSTCAELQTYGANANTRFDTLNLTNDIDCTGVTFLPMYGGTAFSGTFDGHNHRITNLTINRPSNDYAGLFASVTGTIQNLRLDSGSVTGRDYTGALVGEVSGDVTISNVTSGLSVTGRSNVGGLIGSLYTGTAGSVANFTDSSSTGNITATGNFIGGFIGIAAADNSSATFARVFATGNLTNTGGDSTGGLIGFARTDGSAHASSLTVQDAYARGNITATGHNTLGGLVANIQALGSTYIANVTLSRTYATGTINGNSHIGGLVGYTYDNNSANGQVVINNSFATGAITTATPANTGAMVGVNNIVSPRSIASTANYYDGPGTGLSNCSTANIAMANCMNINTTTQPTYFKGNHTNAPMSAWDFSTIWVTNAGTYPTFVPTDDGDGISAAVEAAAPNAGDANGDGILDSQQTNVATFSDAVNSHYVALQSSCGNLFNVQVGAESSTQADVAFSYPAGLLRFVATGCATGATATITQYFYGLTDPTSFTMRKWNSSNNTYTTIPGATLSAVTIGGQTAVKVVYQITDGGVLDQDGLTDGNIVDPAGPGQNIIGAPNTGLGGLRR